MLSWRASLPRGGDHMPAWREREYVEAETQQRRSKMARCIGGGRGRSARGRTVLYEATCGERGRGHGGAQRAQALSMAKSVHIATISCQILLQIQIERAQASTLKEIVLAYSWLSWPP